MFSEISSNLEYFLTFTICRLFCIGFTRKQEMSTKKTAYAQAGQVIHLAETYTFLTYFSKLEKMKIDVLGEEHPEEDD